MSDTLTLEEKQAKAASLIAEVKEAAAKGGGDDGQDYEAHRRKFDEARALMTEVKAEKNESERKELLTLLDAFEKQTAAPPKGDEDDGIVTSAKSRLTELEEARAKKGDGDGSYDLMRAKQRVAIKDKDETRFMFKAFRPENFEKAMIEGTAASGGYLVVPEYMQDLFAAVRGQGNALRRYGWLNVHPTTSNVIFLPRGTNATTVGWTAELATKPSADLGFAQLQINIFTLAGLAYASLQLVADGDPAAADMALNDLALRLADAEEKAIINGSGSGQPLGILGSAGIVDKKTVITASPSGQLVIDTLLDAVLGIQTGYYGAPNGILMHPRRLSFLQKTKDGNNNYIFNAANTYRVPGGFSTNNFGVTAQTEGTVAGLPELFGLPIGVSTNIPTNLTYGSGTNEDAIIVGAWNEAHWFQRQDVTVDTTTEGAGTFETNQQAWRLEERAGFTAGRFPSAFAVVGGPGMV
jgi:HK97 family phage major capsid protein